VGHWLSTEEDAAMSCYEIKTPQHTIVVGWDGPLQSYFAQIWRGEPESQENVDPSRPWSGPEPLLWTGVRSKEVPTVEALAESVKPYVDIWPGLKVSLEHDRAHGPTATRPPFAGLFDPEESTTQPVTPKSLELNQERKEPVNPKAPGQPNASVSPASYPETDARSESMSNQPNEPLWSGIHAEKQQAIRRDAVGDVRLAIWNNGAEREPTFTLQRAYRSPQGGERTAQSFRRKDLGDLQTALQLVAQRLGQDLACGQLESPPGKPEVLCSLASGRFNSVITAQWRPVSETYRYETKILCDNCQLYSRLFKHELAGLERIIQRDLQRFVEARAEVNDPGKRTNDLDHLLKVVRTSHRLIALCIERGHEAVLQDASLTRELGLARCSSKPAQGQTEEPEQEIDV
jgi:hypothetical protein